MKTALLDRVRRYLAPMPDRELTVTMDRQSLRNISHVSLTACIFETLTLLIFTTIAGWRLDRQEVLVSVLSVGLCALFSLAVYLISRKMNNQKQPSHRATVIFKITVFVVYSLWAILADLRHYTVQDQMLTFITVQMLMVCFVLLKPWAGIVLNIVAYGGLYIGTLLVRQGEGMDIFNLIMLAVLSAVCISVRYHTQLYLGRKEEQLKQNTKALEESVRRDPLTGLQNRLALEEAAKETDGRPVRVCMIDINFFKEINDRYGHLTGDVILKETGEALKKLFPEALCYRYGGDEFLVLCRENPDAGYAESVYRFQKETAAGTVDVLLSIGCAQGTPANYQELFELISEADKALYQVKARTCSPEFGGHDRRRRRT